MTDAKVRREKREPIFHIAKRKNSVRWKDWTIRLIAGVSALILCGILSSIVGGKFGGFFGSLFSGTFGTPRRIWKLFQNTFILLGIALAVTPAFKMRFWNIGAEGQTLMAAWGSAAVIWYLGGKVPEGALFVLMLLASVVCGAIWAVIPAIFKALWNTNETLFTLMMNYIAINIVGYFINTWVKTGSAVVGILHHGDLPDIAGQAYLINILVIAVVTFLVYVYLQYSKHGYEISVVGESERTAKYIGINVKKVIIRTMVVSGLLCGVVGFLLVAGTHNTITKELVGGMGFTAILVSWLAKFNPIAMIVTAFLVTFISQGSSQAAMDFRMGTADAFSEIMVGVFFFFIIGCEFFIRYRLVFRADIEEKLVPIREFFAKFGKKMTPVKEFFVWLFTPIKECFEWLFSFGKKPKPHKWEKRGEKAEVEEIADTVGITDNAESTDAEESAESAINATNVEDKEEVTE